MRTIVKSLAIGALVAPAVLGAAGVSSAVEAGPGFGQQSQSADWMGGAGSGTHAGHGWGGPGYVKTDQAAGADGAASAATISGVGPDGRAFYYTVANEAGPYGAASSTTGSHS